MIAKQCQEQGVPFLDLTVALREAEAKGTSLYWPFDGHMQAAGYQLSGRVLADWWVAESAKWHENPSVGLVTTSSIRA